MDTRSPPDEVLARASRTPARGRAWEHGRRGGGGGGVAHAKLFAVAEHLAARAAAAVDPAAVVGRAPMTPRPLRGDLPLARRLAARAARPAAAVAVSTQMDRRLRAVSGDRRPPHRPLHGARARPGARPR